MTYTYNGYKFTMHNTHAQDKMGHFKVRYTLRNPQGQVLFSGQDFGASPLHSPCGKDSACALLIFLTLCPGDTDSEYFDNYTPAQMEFANTVAEDLGYSWRLHLGDRELAQ